MIYWHNCSVMCALMALTSLVAVIEHADANGEMDMPSRDVIIDTSIPFGAEVREQITDERSIWVWSTYQAGVIQGWHYRFTPDGYATFSPSVRLDSNVFHVVCRKQKGCTIIKPDLSEIEVGPGGLAAESAKDAGVVIAGIYIAWLYKVAGVVDAGSTVTSPDDERSAVVVPKMKVLKVLIPSVKVQPVVVADERTVHRSRKANANADVLQKVAPTVATPIKVRQKPIAHVEGQQPSVMPLEEANFPVRNVKDGNANMFSCGLFSGYSLRYFDNASNQDKRGKKVMSLGCFVQVTPALSFRANLNDYLESAQQQPWDPDYTYALEYKIGDKISLGYSNYSGNRFPGHSGGTGGVSAGNFRVNYSLPNQTVNAVGQHIPFIEKLRCTTSAGFSPKYQTVTETKTGKVSVGLNCSFSPATVAPLKIYLSAIGYPVSGQQQSWDPDYTFSFNYQFKSNFSISYSNYSEGRWWWNSDKSAATGLRNGTITLQYQFN